MPAGRNEECSGAASGGGTTGDEGKTLHRKAKIVWMERTRNVFPVAPFRSPMKSRFFRAAAVLLLMACPSLCAQDFQPSDHGTVTLHLKAGNLALADNAIVSAWGPLIAAGSAQPIFVAADARFNNQPVVRFDGINDLMTKSAANLPARTRPEVSASPD